jgi:hypothetical protein
MDSCPPGEGIKIESSIAQTIRRKKEYESHQSCMIIWVVFLRCDRRGRVVPVDIKSCGNGTPSNEILLCVLVGENRFAGALSRLLRST